MKKILGLSGIGFPLQLKTNTVPWLGQTAGATGSGTRIYPYCMYWLFETYSLWMDTLLSLDTVGRALDLPQSNVPYPL